MVALEVSLWTTLQVELLSITLGSDSPNATSNAKGFSICNDPTRENSAAKHGACRLASPGETVERI